MSSSQWQPSVFQFGISFRTRQGQAPLGWLACLWLRIYEQHFGPSVGLAHPRLCTKPQIFEVFLEQGKMWTEATEEEEKLGFNPDVRVERTIGMPEREPALRVMPRDYSDSYFDGRDLYADDSYRLTRIQPDGTTFVVSYGGHGDSERYLVNDEYVFVNYDALCPVRLPRKFHTCGLPGSENPEAILPWGREDYRL